MDLPAHKNDLPPPPSPPPTPPSIPPPTLNLSPLNPPANPNPTYQSTHTIANPSPHQTFDLGPIDAAFCPSSTSNGPPILVDLLLSTSTPLATSTVTTRLTSLLTRNPDLSILLGVLTPPRTITTRPSATLPIQSYNLAILPLLNPPSPTLFTPPTPANPLFTLRLTHLPTTTLLGLTFSHALTDIHGLTLLLHSILTSDLVPLHHDRQAQSHFIIPRPISPPPPRSRPPKSPIAQLTYHYTPTLLSSLALPSPQSRHTLIIGDVVATLARITGLHEFSLSRDGRRRGEVTSTHFGNLTTITTVPVPPIPTPSNVIDALQAALSNPASPATPQLPAPSPLHITSWHRPLYGIMPYLATATLGPLSYNAGLKIAKHTGCVNVTVLPDGEDLVMTMRGSRVVLEEFWRAKIEGREAVRAEEKVVEKKQETTVVWLHGVGEEGNWKEKVGTSFAQMFPVAPSLESSKSWFALPTYPITTSSVPTIASASESIHALLSTITTPNIILAGFSQGAALALHAGLTYPPGVTAIVALSGWVPNVDTFQQWRGPASPPIFYSVGTGDKIVDFKVSKKGGELIKNMGGVVQYVQRGCHMAKDREIEDCNAFVAGVVLGKKVAERPVSKRMKALREFRRPRPERSVSEFFFGTAVLKYSKGMFDFGGAVEEGDLVALSSCEATDRPRVVREKFVKLCDVYEEFVRRVVGPHMNKVGGQGAVLYQFPPTVRVVEGCGEGEGVESCRGRWKLGPMHCDFDYGHQPGEVNFWMVVKGGGIGATLWAESEAGKGDFGPVLAGKGGGVGEVRRFHGQSCRHLAVTGRGEGTVRVSLDFRCCMKEQFDEQWKAPGCIFYHEMRELRDAVEEAVE